MAVRYMVLLAACGAVQAAANAGTGLMMVGFVHLMALNLVLGVAEGLLVAAILHRNPWLPPSEDETQTVIPQANRAVIFETTEDSWHGFRRIALPETARDLTRRSVAVYFYTRERPAEQTVPGDGFVTGYGEIDGRQVFVFAHDFTVMGGSL